MTSSDLRWAWALLGILLALGFLPPVTVKWIVATAVPWGLVAWALVRAPRPLADGAAGRLLDQRCVRKALVLWGALLVVAAALFGVWAALVLLDWLAAAYVLAGWILRPPQLRTALVWGAGLATGFVALCLGGELLLRTPGMATRFGGSWAHAYRSRGYDGLWQHNVFGFRSPYETVARKPGVRRVLTLGSGYTWGDDILQTDSTWPAQLERGLRASYPGQDVEVINMGRTAGFTLPNMAELLRRLGWQFQPDLVLVEFNPNEGRVSGPDFQHVTSEGVSLLHWRFREGRIRSSALFSALDFWYAAWRHHGPSYTDYFDYYREGALGYRQLEAALREMGREGKAHGVPVVLLLYPDLVPGHWTSQSYVFREVFEHLTDVARQSGMEVVDLVPVFAAQGLDGKRWWAEPWLGNPNEAAHRVAARATAKFIVQKDWLRGH